MEGPKLSELPGKEQGTTAVIAGGILEAVLLLVYQYYKLNENNKKGSCNVEKAQRSLSEQTQLEHSITTPEVEERESLLSNATSVAHLSSQISIE